MAQHVTVVNFNPLWASLYEQEAESIRHILGNLLLAVHHIGSTAVPGLKAKPIIDIMPVVTAIAAVDAYRPRFEEIGYECLGEFGIPGRRYFRKGGMERTHQVHVFGSSSAADIERHLAVRDYLKSHVEAAGQYGALKSRLAAQHPYDIEGYCDGKDAFMKDLERRALLWYRTIKQP